MSFLSLFILLALILFVKYTLNINLYQGYLQAVSDPSLLNILESSDKFMIKLTDEERLEIKEKALEEGIKEGKFETAKNLLKKTQDIQFIRDVTGLSENEIKNLQ